jgi:hypothetical protein
VGNWVSRAEVAKALAAIEMETVPVLNGTAAYDGANRILRERGRLVVIGFDTLQVPRYKIGFERTPS